MPIVAAVDDTENAERILREASELSRDLDTDLHGVHVFERDDLIDVIEKDLPGQDITDNIEVQELVEGIVDRGLSTSDDVTTVAKVGDSADEIIRYAEDIGARYIVIGGQQRSPTGKALFGSVTQKVILRSSIPVLSVGDGNQ